MELTKLTSHALLDAHVHLDFMRNAREVATDAAAHDLALFANSVTPSGFLRIQREAGDLPNVRVGLGLHPWWVANGRCGDEDVADFERLASQTRWIGEVGLDLSPKRGNHDGQRRAFARIATVCGEQGDKVMSVHSVRAVSEVLDVLESTGCLERCACIFHWFSGSTEELWRAIRAGCWFSVNEMQASTRRAKEQLKLIPANRLLFETDLPPGEGVVFSADEIVASLERAQKKARAIRD